MPHYWVIVRDTGHGQAAGARGREIDRGAYDSDDDKNVCETFKFHGKDCHVDAVEAPPTGYDKTLICSHV
jgi:hypothetical protein